MVDINGSMEVLRYPTALLNAFFPGFSIIASAIYEYLKIDAAIYIPAMLLVSLLVFSSQYSGEYLWCQVEAYFMSTADIRVDDELYNMLMAVSDLGVLFPPWLYRIIEAVQAGTFRKFLLSPVAQDFSKSSRRFVANIDINSRAWYPLSTFRDDEESVDEEDEEQDFEGHQYFGTQEKNKPLQYTPSFGAHFFWYKSRLILFKRTQSRQQGYVAAYAREQISLSSFGRNPAILKTLLNECRLKYLENDENKTLIYRGIINARTAESCWRRCMSRPSRPLSTIVINETIKQELLDDLRDYLHPHTKQWYSNRGIPYRRGYLLYGPPGTGKSSLSFAIAGYFKLKIYIMSLNSLAMNEQNLSTLFAELPKRCIVLLEDVDTADLTHTRQIPSAFKPEQHAATLNLKQGRPVLAMANKISLSALLNVIDGVASQEGRVLIMTTNHVDKLDNALIRPGRVDMKVKFDLASSTMIVSLFHSIFVTLEGDIPKLTADWELEEVEGINWKLEGQKRLKEVVEEEQNKKEEEERIDRLAHEFAAVIPADTFSPAEIQGFLLTHKRHPEMAVAEGVKWAVTRQAERVKEKEAKDAEAEL